MADVIMYYLIIATVVAVYLRVERGSSYFGAIIVSLTLPLFIGLGAVFVAMTLSMWVVSCIQESITSKGDPK